MANDERPCSAMRIMLVEPAGAGGMAHYTYSLAQALACRAEVWLATSVSYELQAFPRSFELLPLFEPAFLPEKRVSAARVRAVGANLTNVYALLSAVRKCDPHVVHVQGTVSPQLEPALFRLNRALGGPIVVSTVHELAPYEQPERFRRSWSASFRASTGVIVHSRYVAEELAREYGMFRDLWVVPQGEYDMFSHRWPMEKDEARRMLGLAPERRLLLFFGYMREYKGLGILEEAWPRAVAGGLPGDVDLALVGKVAPEVRSSVDRLVSEGGTRVHVRRGYVDDRTMAAYLTAADALVAPYRACHTSGLVTLAFSFGRPVVATAVGSLPEHIRDGRNGRLARPDDPADLARCIVDLFRPGVIPRFSRAVCRASQALTWSGAARDTLHFYSRLRAVRNGGA